MPGITSFGEMVHELADRVEAHPARRTAQNDNAPPALAYRWRLIDERIPAMPSEFSL
jgi:hypothetical protein